jgi:hypothetical protein
MSGYSSTPLAKKLGIKQGCRMRLANAPDDYFQLFTDFPEAVQLLEDEVSPKDCIHFFARKASELLPALIIMKQEIFPAGMIWVSWYKKDSGISTDITEDLIRQIALANGLVDIKVCAVSDVWSGLKLVIPVKNRKLSA